MKRPRKGRTPGIWKKLPVTKSVHIRSFLPAMLRPVALRICAPAISENNPVVCFRMSSRS